MPSCVAVAPGSMLTNASPSTNCGLPIHCRRSWNSACITPTIAGPPYAVRPILRKLVTISRIEPPLIYLFVIAISRGLVLPSVGPRDLFGAVTKRPEDQIALRGRRSGKERLAEERIDVLPDDLSLLSHFEEAAVGRARGEGGGG